MYVQPSSCEARPSGRLRGWECTAFADKMTVDVRKVCQGKLLSPPVCCYVLPIGRGEDDMREASIAGAIRICLSAVLLIPYPTDQALPSLGTNIQSGMWIDLRR